jgi:hypothetical protein
MCDPLLYRHPCTSSSHRHPCTYGRAYGRAENPEVRHYRTDIPVAITVARVYLSLSHKCNTRVVAIPSRAESLGEHNRDTSYGDTL